MSTIDRISRPPTRPRTRRRRSARRGPDLSILLTLLALVLGSTGFGLTLLPGGGTGGLAVLVAAGVLLLAGLERSVREDLAAGR